MQGGSTERNAVGRQHGRAENARAVAQRGFKNRGLEAVVEEMLPDLGADFFPVEGVDVAHAAADDDGVRVENIDDSRDSEAEIFDEPADCRGGVGVARRSASDIRQPESRAGERGVAPFQRRAGEDGLHAAPLAAVARRAVFFQDIVAPLARDSVQAVQRMAVDDDAAPHARAEDDAEYRGLAARRAERALGQREAVGVVRHGDPHTERGFQVFAERPADEADGIRVLQRPEPGVEHARRPDAQGFRKFPPALFRHAPDKLPYAANDVAVTPLRLRFNTAPQQRLTPCTPFHDDPLDFRSAQVDPPQRRMALHNTPPGRCADWAREMLFRLVSNLELKYI